MITAESQQSEVALPAAARSRRPQPTASSWKRRTASWSRWLHVYLSMISFAILFFFAATGVTLNHIDWFAHQQRSKQVQGSLNPDWVKAGAPGSPSKLEIVEFLRSRHKIPTALSDFRIDDYQCSVSFKGPGYSADAFVDRESGKYALTENRMGFVAVLNDLHKGRDTGVVWKWTIDVSAALMCLVSLSGIILIFYLKKMRLSGLVTVAVGLAVSSAIYALWVP